MPKAVVIGATGHIGSYLVPELVRAGYDLVAMSRGNRVPYTAHWTEWQSVEHVYCSREEGIAIAAGFKPDVICDLVPYTATDASALVNNLRAEGIADRVRLISIGSIWIYDQKLEVPVTEEHPRTAKDDYGRGKIEIEQYLLNEHRKNGLRVTILHPGHICGSGWMPVGPLGNRDPQVIRDIIAGRPILLPERGQTTLHHVHSEDIARLTLACLNNDRSISESFHSVCETALTLFGFAEGAYRHFGQTPAEVFVPYSEFLKRIPKEHAADSAEHIDHSPMASMAKAKALLGFTPKHSAMDTVLEAIDSIRDSL
ncbi:MAG: NAD-dependent epimerase/dehydratase family protein [Christensenella sp.]|nr:NAD-dependent epimerase/dehydratase family protein [Christensenella sp.]